METRNKVYTDHLVLLSNRFYGSESLRRQVTQPAEKLPTFYGTQIFITVLTRARHWSLFSARWIQSVKAQGNFTFTLLYFYPDSARNYGTKYM